MAKMTVEDTSLTAVADAIRTKGGTTDPLTFPDGFVDAVGNIQTGIDPTLIGKLAQGTITEVTAEMMEGCTELRSYAFNYCKSLTSVVIPDTVTKIGEYAFQYCEKLTKVVMPSGVKITGGGMFRMCSNLEEALIPEGSMTTLQNHFYQNCKNLKVATIPQSVTAIQAAVFQGCGKLTSLVIPSGVKSIGDVAFHNCSGLKTLELKPTTPPTLGGTIAFVGTPNLRIIVPKGSLSAYQSATNWSAEANKMEEATE